MTLRDTQKAADLVPLFSWHACSKCGVEKPATHFYKNRAECISCHKAYKDKYRSNPKRRREAVERAQRWREANWERYLETQRRYKRENASRIQRANRERHLRKKYGIGLEEYAAFARRQKNACAICRQSEEDGLHVDHDHQTGAVRGLLCGRCNKAIGLLDDDPQRARALAVYLLRGSRRLEEDSRP